MNQNPPQGWDGPFTSEFAPVQQPDNGPVPQKQGTSPVLIVALTVVVMLLIGLIALVTFLLVPRLNGSDSVAAPVTSTVQVTATESADQSPVRPAESAPPVRPAQGGRPSGAYECLNTGAGQYSSASVGSNQTSCEFAGSVWSEYQLVAGNGQSATINAYSPVTGAVYTMSCSGGAVVTCTGGNNAVVYIY